MKLVSKLVALNHVSVVSSMLEGYQRQNFESCFIADIFQRNDHRGSESLFSVYKSSVFFTRTGYAVTAFYNWPYQGIHVDMIFLSFSLVL